MKFLFLSLFFWSSFVQATPILTNSPHTYEDCDCYNQEITDRMTAQFLSDGDGACIDCSEEAAIGSPNTDVSQYMTTEGEKVMSVWGNPSGLVHPHCVLASNGRTTKPSSGRKQYRVCLKDRKTYYQSSAYPVCGKQVYVRRYCLNKPYVDMTTKALNDVGRCLKIPPKNLFPLFNHESRFVLNNRSPTGAMCYGQLTADTVETLNNYSRLNYDYYSNGNRHALDEGMIDGLRLDNILEECKDVAAKFSKLKTIRKFDSKGNEYVTYNGTDSFCDVVENPYTCLLYSALNHKMNLEYARYYTGLGKVWISTNKKDGKQIIHKDKDTMVHFDNKVKDSPNWNYLEYKEVSIFKDPEQVAEIAALFAYNGGSRTVKTLFADYIREFRRRLDNSNNKTLRANFFDGAIETEHVMKEFKNYIATHYKWGNVVERRKEVSTFVDKIIRDLKTVTNDYGKGANHCSSTFSHIYEAATK